MLISASPALPLAELPAIESPKSRRCPIVMQMGVSPLRLSRPKPCPCPVPQCPLPSPDLVSPPRSSVAAPTEAAESSAASDSTILPPSPKLKPKPHKPRLLLKHQSPVHLERLRLLARNIAVTPQMNFPWKITFDMLYTNEFLIRVRSRALSIPSERNTI